MGGDPQEVEMIQRNIVFKIVGWGLLAWLIPYIVSIPLFQVIGENRVVFRSLLSVVVALSVVMSWGWYRRSATAGLAESVGVSFAWVAIAVGADWVGLVIPFQMDPLVYLMEVATAYLIIPVILLGQGRKTGSKT